MKLFLKLMFFNLASVFLVHKFTFPLACAQNLWYNETYIASFNRKEDFVEDILTFDGDNAFLSNFWSCPVHVCFPDAGVCYTFPSSEHAFQAAKCPARAAEHLELSAGQSKRLGRKVEMRKDWEEIKDEVMYEIVYAKFSQNPSLAEKLLDTEDVLLVEGNTWGDTYWGQVDGVGRNQLGKTLMRVREELREQSK